MAFEHKELTGRLFVNERKQQEKHPDYQGKAKIDGTNYYVSMWFAQTQGGTDCLNLRFKPVDEEQQQESKPVSERPVPSGFAKHYARQQKNDETRAAQQQENVSQSPEPGTQRDIDDDDIPF